MSEPTNPEHWDARATSTCGAGAPVFQGIVICSRWMPNSRPWFSLSMRICGISSRCSRMGRGSRKEYARNAMGLERIS
eukprot:8527003-Lingulodinium_polyedra.AAC.1